MALLMTLVLLWLASFDQQAECQLQQPSITYPEGSSLSANEPSITWNSSSGRFAFGFYRQGDGYKVGIWLVGSPSNTIVWTARRDDPPVSADASLQFISGKLQLKTDEGPVIPITDQSDADAASVASLMDTGNLVLYRDGRKVWESFSYPTDTMLGGQYLNKSMKLISSVSLKDHSSGRFRLEMQDDGNLVAYPANAGKPVDSYWNSGTFDDVLKQLSLETSGRLVLLQLNSRIVRVYVNPSVQNPGTVFRFTLDFDGNFRLYSHRWSPSGDSNVSIEWEGIDNLCQVKGFCEFNSFCALLDNKTSCICLPSTTSAGLGQVPGHCTRKLAGERCIDGKHNVSAYSSLAWTNISWEDPPYFVSTVLGSEDCGRSCLEDCNCDAALFDRTNRCMKHKFPLRYVRSVSDGVVTAIFKFQVNETAFENRTSEPTKTPWVTILALSLGFVSYSCVVLVLSGFFIFKMRVLKYQKLLKTGKKSLIKDFTLRNCSYNELKKATNGFKEELGRGSFGAVYRGAFHRGEILVAVKRLEKLVEDGEREFRAEMRVIGKTRHKNLVRLLGYCAEGSKRLLVYAYMSNGSLSDLLFKSSIRPIWSERVRIAQDVAKGILYLHDECETPIIHCDIKPQNILLDELWTAKLSDFGLAKLLMPDQTRTFTGARGTRGYIAPEWQKNAPISLKVDIYSYGIVLLEIICCRRNIEVNLAKPEETLLSTWAYKCFTTGELHKLLGGEEVEKKTLERMIMLALWCIQDEPTLRPSAKGVMQMLEGISDIPIPPCPTDI